MNARKNLHERRLLALANTADLVTEVLNSIKAAQQVSDLTSNEARRHLAAIVRGIEEAKLHADFVMDARMGE